MRISLRVRSPTPTEAITCRPARVSVPSRPMRVLDLDIENRPLTYLGSDFTTAEVTAIAWAWTDQPEAVTVHLLGETELPFILRAFCAAYDHADMVTGHYLRGHDLPMINGALVEFGLPVLPDRRVQDTKVDFVRTKGISLSQESLGAMLRLDAAKVQMNQARWRAANRLTADGLALVRERVVGDVRQHIELRRELLAKGYLRPPTLWRSGSAAQPIEAYVP